jgi:hypothetical protein
MTKIMMRRGRHEEEAIAHKSREESNANDSAARLFKYRGVLCSLYYIVPNEVFEHLGAFQ